MLKKIFLFIFISLAFFFSYNFSYGACNIGAGGIKSSLEGCLGNADLIQGGPNLYVEDGFKIMIVDFIKKISTFLAILAVGSIAYGSMVMVTSVGSDEKIKKGRNIIKWSLIGFVVLVSAAGIIQSIIYIVYDL